MDIDDGEGSAFGTELRQLRNAAGFTQEELAERAGLTAAGVSALERGHRRRPYLHTVHALAAALGLPEGQRDALLTASRHAAAATRTSGPHSEAIATRPILPLSLASFIRREREVVENQRPRDPGEHRLQDVHQPEPLFQLVTP